MRPRGGRYGRNDWHNSRDTRQVKIININWRRQSTLLWAILTGDEGTVNGPIPKGAVRSGGKIVRFGLHAIGFRAVNTETKMTNSVDRPPNDDAEFGAVRARWGIEDSCLTPVERDGEGLLTKHDHVGG